MRSTEEEDLLNPRLQKIHYSDIMQQGSSPLISLSTGPQTKMLSFSNPRSESNFLTKNGGFGQSSEFPHYGYTVNTGYGSGVHAPVMESGVGGLFTSSQWIELQHQALVYKYIQANVAVPSGLLLGIKRSVSPYLSGLHSGSYSYTPNSWGWGGSFHLGFSGNNTDPEPGRCRRTDGKKWRCSRDAALEQKYCERHLNRGRNRSRKLVDGRVGQSAVAGKAPTAAAAAAAPSASVTSGHGVASSSLVVPTQTHAADNPSTYHVKFNRMADDQGLSVVNPATDSKSKDSIFSIPKQRITTQAHSHSDFVLVSSNSFLNPSIKSSFMNNTTSFDPIIPFNGSDCATWTGELKPDWTQLSMAIPMSSDSCSSPRDKMMPSPLSLPHELDPNHKEMNWVPVSWGNSMGGPLGEVLLNNTRSSPTGVLQKTDFRSLSNSSCGSSPRGETKKMDGPGDDTFGPYLTTSMFLPSL